jgi:hypothetical protein
MGKQKSLALLTWLIAAIEAVAVLVIDALVPDGLEPIKALKRIATRRVAWLKSWVKAPYLGCAMGCVVCEKEGYKPDQERHQRRTQACRPLLISH